jgi:hypothetical protein
VPSAYPAAAFDRVLHLRGPAAWRGAQHGALLGAEIRGAAAHAVDLLSGALAIAPRDVLERARAALDAAGPETQAELRALAEAASLDPASAAALAFIDEVWERWGCAAVVAGDSPSERVVGHNTDFPSGPPQHTALLLVVEPEGGIPYATPGWSGMLAGSCGMNEAGLVLTVQIAELGAPSAPTPGRVAARVLLAQALSTCETAERAARLLESAGVTLGATYVAADAEDAWAVELAPGRAATRRAPRFAVGNHFETPGWGCLQPADARRASESVRSHLAEALARHEGPTDSAQRVMDALCADGVHRVATGPLALATVRTAVFEPGSRRLWLAHGRVPARQAGFCLYSLPRELRTAPGLHIAPHHIDYRPRQGQRE